MVGKYNTSSIGPTGTSLKIDDSLPDQIQEINTLDIEVDSQKDANCNREPL